MLDLGTLENVLTEYLDSDGPLKGNFSNGSSGQADKFQQELVNCSALDRVVEFC